MARLLPVLCLLLLFSTGVGCGLFGSASTQEIEDQPPAPVPAPASAEAVVLQADNFLFKPNLIRAPAGGTLSLAVTNVSDQLHDLTVKNPAGEVIIQVDLPPHVPVQVTVPLPVAGDYPFECSRPFHAKLGMTGRIVAE